MGTDRIDECVCKQRGLNFIVRVCKQNYYCSVVHLYTIGDGRALSTSTGLLLWYCTQRIHLTSGMHRKHRPDERAAEDGKTIFPGGVEDKGCRWSSQGGRLCGPELGSVWRFCPGDISTDRSDGRANDGSRQWHVGGGIATGYKNMSVSVGPENNVDCTHLGPSKWVHT